MGIKVIKKKVKGWNNSGHPLACPHCGAGVDGNTLGLYWDFYEHCWRCIICGYRKYKHATQSKSKKEIEQERLLEQVMDSLD